MTDETTPSIADNALAAVKAGITMPEGGSFRLSAYDGGVREIIRIDAPHMAGLVVVGFKEAEAVASSARVKKVQRFPYTDPDHVTKILAFIHEQMKEWNPEELDIHDYMRVNSMIMSEKLLKIHGGG
jgi:hypothetical protein